MVVDTHRQCGERAPVPRRPQPCPPPPTLPITRHLSAVRAVFKRKVPVPGGGERQGEPGREEKERNDAPDSDSEAAPHRAGVGPLQICANSRCSGITQSEFFRHQPRVCGAPKCHKGAAWATFLSPESGEGDPALWLWWQRFCFSWRGRSAQGARPCPGLGAAAGEGGGGPPYLGVTAGCAPPSQRAALQGAGLPAGGQGPGELSAAASPTWGARAEEGAFPGGAGGGKAPGRPTAQSPAAAGGPERGAAEAGGGVGARQGPGSGKMAVDLGSSRAGLQGRTEKREADVGKRGAEDVARAAWNTGLGQNKSATPPRKMPLTS